MAELQKNRDSKNIWHSPLVLFVLLCIVLVFSYNMIGLIKKAHQTAKEKNVVLQQINDLNQRQTSLQTNINQLQNDAGVEQTIRNKYELVKPGEQMVVIVDPTTSNSSNQSEASKPISFWSWLKSIF